MSKGEQKGLIWGGIIFGIVLAVVLSFNLISTEAIQLIITFVLVSITAIYVKRTSDISKATREQAEASVKMAKEMKKQRYDAVRPVIDIQIGGMERVVENQTSYILSFTLHNIGLGPAIGVCSVTPTPIGGRWRWDYDTLAAGGRKKVTNFSMEQEEGLLTVSVHYTDIYDRHFESGRQVNIDNEKVDWKIGPLLIRTASKY